MKVAVVGMGLIGGSFYKASLAAGYATTGLHHGDRGGLADADLVIVALPTDAIVPWIRGHAADFKRGAAVVDICGIKRKIAEAMASVPQEGWTFVGGHPMAGKEVAGFENSTAELFKGASMILTPAPSVPRELLDSLGDFFRKLGFGRVVETTPRHHDEMIAFTSQLGHVVAAAYARDELTAEAPGYSAGSYRDMTRIATMDPQGWASLFLENRDELLKTVDRFAERLADFRGKLAANDRVGLAEYIREGAEAKRRDIAARKEQNHV